jgi:hypothetical protein
MVKPLTSGGCVGGEITANKLSLFFAFCKLCAFCAFELAAHLRHGLDVPKRLRHASLAQDLRPVHAEVRRSNIPGLTQNSDFKRPLLRGFSA